MISLSSSSKIDRFVISGTIAANEIDLERLAIEIKIAYLATMGKINSLYNSAIFVITLFLMK